MAHRAEDQEPVSERKLAFPFTDVFSILSLHEGGQEARSSVKELSTITSKLESVTDKWLLKVFGKRLIIAARVLGGSLGMARTLSPAALGHAFSRELCTWTGRALFPRQEATLDPSS